MPNLSNLVLLTATVTPNVKSGVSIVDPTLRLEQYQAGIRAWHDSLRKSTFKLAVVETSDADTDELLARIPPCERNRVRVMHYVPSASEVRRGKGAIEMGAIESALQSYDGLTDESTVYKCTGRLRVLNLSRIVLPAGQREIRARMLVNRSWVDTRLIGADLLSWKTALFGSGLLVDDARGVYIEHALAARISMAIALGRARIARFPERPIFEGISGSTGARYGSTLANIVGRLSTPLERILHDVAAKKQT